MLPVLREEYWGGALKTFEREVWLAILLISTGSVLGVISVLFGFVWLMSMDGVLTIPSHPITRHPDLIIFGFLQLFIMGVGVVLLPRFHNRRVRVPVLAAAGCILVSFPAVASIVAVDSDQALILPFRAAEMAGSALLAAAILLSLGRPDWRFGGADCYVYTGFAGLLLVQLLRVLGAAGLLKAWSYSDPAVLVITLFGFPVSFIAGVVSRTIHFRIAKMERRLSLYSFAAFLLSLASAGAAWYAGSRLLLIVSILSLALWFILFAKSTQFFKVDRGSQQFERMNERDRVRYLYFARTLQLAGAWMMASLGLGLAYHTSGLNAQLVYAVRDAYIHSLTIGFIGHVIVAYGPIVIPGLLSRRMPYIGLSTKPALLLTLGNALRIAGFTLDSLTGIATFTRSISGALLLAGITGFLVMTHRLKP
jgi:hypothetical protein